MSERALRHAISSRSGVPKLKGHQPPALGTHYFRNAPAQVHYYPTKTYTQLAEMNHELVLQVFCAHYGRHLPLSQGCHAMLPGLSLYLLKSESELDHTTNLLNHTNQPPVEPKPNMISITVLYIHSKSGIFPLFQFCYVEVVIIHS